MQQPHLHVDPNPPQESAVQSNFTTESMNFGNRDLINMMEARAEEVVIDNKIPTH